MITARQLEKLEAAAQGWVGTPFCEGTPRRGAGVACHHLCAEVFFDAGFIARRPIPNGPASWAASQPQSLIESWVESSRLFARADAPQPGDMLGFRIGHAIHHAAVMLGRGRIVHSIVGHGVLIAPCIPAVWLKRLERIWRLRAIADQS